MGNSNNHYKYKSSSIPPYQPIAKIGEHIHVHYVQPYKSEIISKAIPFREKKVKKTKGKKRALKKKVKQTKKELKSRLKTIDSNHTSTALKPGYVFVGDPKLMSNKKVKNLVNSKDKRLWFVTREEETTDAVQKFEADDSEFADVLSDSSKSTSRVSKAVIAETKPRDEKTEEEWEEEFLREAGYDKDYNPLKPVESPQINEENSQPLEENVEKQDSESHHDESLAERNDEEANEEQYNEETQEHPAESNLENNHQTQDQEHDTSSEEGDPKSQHQEHDDSSEEGAHPNLLDETPKQEPDMVAPSPLATHAMVKSLNMDDDNSFDASTSDGGQ